MLHSAVRATMGVVVVIVRTFEIVHGTVRSCHSNDVEADGVNRPMTSQSSFTCGVPEESFGSQ